MSKTIYALSGALALQAALAVGMNLSSRGFAAEAARRPLLGFQTAGLDRLTIADGQGHSVALAKTAQGWTLPDAGGFPADASKVKTLLTALAGAKEGAPVATSAEAPHRFKVAKAAFERKLVFGPTQDPLETLYLGTSQGTRQVYARRAGQSGVHLIDFQTYQAPTRADDWIDSAALEIPVTKIAGIAWGDVRLTELPAKPAVPAAKSAAKPEAKPGAKPEAKPQAPAAPRWQIAFGGAAPRPADANDVAALTDQLASLWASGLATQPPVAAAAASGESPAKSGDLTLTVTLAGGKTLRYRLVKTATEGSVILASNLPRPVKLADMTAKALIAATEAKSFLPPVPAATPVAATAATPAAAPQTPAAAAKPAAPPGG